MNDLEKARNDYAAALEAWMNISERRAKLHNTGAFEVHIFEMKKERGKILLEDNSAKLAGINAAILEAERELLDIQDAQKALDEPYYDAAERLKHAHGKLESAIQTAAHVQYESAVRRLRELVTPILAEAIALAGCTHGVSNFDAKDVLEKAGLLYVKSAGQPAEFERPGLGVIIYSLPKRPEVKQTVAEFEAQRQKTRADEQRQKIDFAKARQAAADARQAAEDYESAKLIRPEYWLNGQRLSKAEMERHNSGNG